jgi:hypothetical protein
MLLLLSGAASGLFAVVDVAATHTDCSDGIDNDEDGKYDYPEDADCASLDDDTEGYESRATFVSITDGKESVRANDTVMYVIRLRQQRESQRDIDVTLHLPSQANLVGADQGGRVIDGRVFWENVTVQKDHVTTLTVQVQITHKAKPEQLLVARVMADGVTATDTTYVKGASSPNEPSKKFTVTVSDGKAYALPGQTLTYTVTVVNRRDTHETIDVRATLPSYVYLEEMPAGADNDRDSVVWRNQTFGPGERRTYTFRGHLQDRVRDGVALYTRAVAGNGSGTDQTVVRRGPPPNKLQVSVTDNRTTVERGQLLTYSIHVRNESNYPEVDPMLAGQVSTFAEFVSATEGGRWDGSNVRWSGQDIASNGTRTFSYTVRVRSDAPSGSKVLGGVILNNELQASDSTEIVDVSREREQGLRVASTREVPIRPRLNDTIPQATTTARGLRITQDSDRSETLPGGRVRFTLSVRNATNRTIDAGAVVSVRYDDAAMRFVSATDGRLVVDGNIRWELPRLLPNETWTTTYVLAARDNAPNGLRTRTVSTISGDFGDGYEDSAYEDRMDSTDVAVIRGMPTTGAPMDVIAMVGASISGLAGSGFAFSRVKKWII